jgi:type VI secretion system protein ImpA
MNMPLSNPIATIDEMLQPIDQITSAGEYLRYDPLYDRIAQARYTEDASLPQGVWQRPTQQADWRLVVELCTEALTHRSKDLQIAIWLMEAWLHLEGLAGYSRGCNLILGLHQYFAATMHPAPELSTGTASDAITLPLRSTDPSVEHRANLIQWLNEKLSIQVKLLPLTFPSAASGVAAFSLADLEAALHQDQLQRRQSSTPQKTTSVNAFERSLVLTELESLAGMWTELQRAIEITDVLDQMFDDCYGPANGGLLKLKDVLQRMERAIAPALPEEEELGTDREENADIRMRDYKPGASLATVTYGSSSNSHMTSNFLDSPSASGYAAPIQSREDAYARLAEISAFLSQLEPHSPVPYLLQRAIAWGSMSLSELLPELLHDQVALREVGTLLRLDGSNESLPIKQ